MQNPRMRKTETSVAQGVFVCEKLFTILPLIQRLSGDILAQIATADKSDPTFSVLAENVEEGRGGG